MSVLRPIDGYVPVRANLQYNRVGLIQGTVTAGVPTGSSYAENDVVVFEAGDVAYFSSTAGIVRETDIIAKISDT